jgi:ABC-type lipoprotein export system ATPase subunit
LILADEPTASLDAQSGLEMMKLFRRLTAQERKTAIVMTQDQRVFGFADRIFWLEEGRIRETTAPPKSTSSAGEDCGWAKCHAWPIGDDTCTSSFQ